MIKRSTLTELAEALQGIPVYGCIPGSPAERAGVRLGDVLLSVDGQATATWLDYIAVREKSGDSIRVRVFREGSELEFDIPLQRVTDTAAAVAAAMGAMGADAADGPAPPPAPLN